MGSSSLFLLRHGETGHNAAGVYQGDSDAPVLSERGRQQLRDLLDHLGELSVTRLLCSPLRRAQETLQFLRADARFQHIPFTVVDDLMETSVPEWLGLKKSDIYRQDHRRLMEWREQPHNFVTAGGVSPVLATLERTRGLCDLLEREPESHLVIGHDHVNRCLLTSLMGLPATLHGSFPLHNASLSHLKKHDDAPYHELQALNLRPSAIESLIREPETPRILLVRHGTTACNRDRIYQGSRMDSPLDENGRAQAEQLGKLLVGIEPRIVISSALSRAKQTATALSLPSRRGSVTDARLNEYEYGHWTGLSADEVENRYPEELEAWRFLREPAPIAGAESLDELADRVNSAAADAWQEAERGGTVVVVAHDVVIRAFICGSLGLGIEQAWKFSMTNGAISELEKKSSGKCVLRCHNVVPGRFGDRRDSDYL